MTQLASPPSRKPNLARPSHLHVVSAPRPSDEPRHASRLGWLVIALFFGLFGGWTLLAPLDGAVIADAVVKVDGNRKPIQHLEGGIVSQIRVHDGDHVAAADIVVVLDDTQARAEEDVLDKLWVVLLLTEARLKAEQRDDASLPLPAALAARTREPAIAAAWQRQATELSARRRESDGQVRLISQRIAQVESQIAGSRAQLGGLTRQRTSIRHELDSLKPLLERGIVTRMRLVQLERTLAALEGQIGEARAAIARGEQAEGEQRQLEVQARNQRASALAAELRDVEMRLAEVVPKLASARAVRARTVVRAPYAGRVVGLNVFAVGGVVGRGERLMDIVPDDGALVVDARVAVQDVAELAAGMTAVVRISGYKSEATPPLVGKLVQVSADRLTDERNGAPYYLAQVRIDEAALAAAPGLHLQPGMQASIVVPTRSRTAFQYLTAPLRASFRTALSER